MKIPNLGDQLDVLNLYPVAAVTADGLSSAIDLLDYEGEVAIILDVKNVAGTTPTLNCKMQQATASGGSYTDVTGGGFTEVTTVASKQKISINTDEVQRFLKLNLDIAGTDSPQYLVSASIVGIKKNPA